MEPQIFIWLALAYAPAAIVWIVQNSQIAQLREDNRRLRDDLAQTRDHIASIEARYDRFCAEKREYQLMKRQNV